MKLGARLSIRHKLLGVVMLTTLVALAVAISAIVGYDLSEYRDALIADMNTQAELLGRTTAPALAFDDLQMAQENLGLMRFRPQIRVAAIYNARGALFGSYVRAGQKPQFPQLPEAEGVRIEGRELVVFRRIVSNREIAGTVYLRADYQIADRVIHYFWIAVIVMLAAMLIALLMLSRLERVVTRPILAIARIARDVMAQRDYSRRAEKLSDDEVGVLVESFNGMLAEIERSTAALETANRELAKEVGERTRAEHEIKLLNESLEERVRERTAELQFTNQELEAFCSSVSHDLRAPLRGIDGFSQILLEDFLTEIPEEGRRFLAKIRAATQNMSDLIEGLLNLSRVSRGVLHRKCVDVSAMARQVVSDLRHNDPSRVVEVSIWDGMMADADPRLLLAVLENLIGNAWKFTSRTKAAQIEIGALRDGENRTFFVRDNGAGFDMAYADKLFGEFQRLHSVADYSGTGIGLATVRRIIVRHGGRVWADGQVGKGAVFFFTLGGHQEPHDRGTASVGEAVPPSEPADTVKELS